MKGGIDKNQDTVGLILSIILASAVAFGLQSLAIYVPENNPQAWAFCSIVLILIAVAIIYYVLGEKIEKIDKSFAFKIALIIFSSLTIFSFSRIFYFASQKGINNTNPGNYYATLLFPGIVGISFCIQGYIEKKNSLIVWGILILIVVGVFYFLKEFFRIGVIA